MPAHRLPNINFEWTPNLAYVVGLLATDGCLSKDGRHIIMRSSDVLLLETFKKCLSLSNRICQTFNDGWAKKPAYKIEFGNVQLYRWLIKIGLFPAKTYTIGELKIPKKYFCDFLRGHLDGDGSIITYTDRWNTFKNPKYVYKRIYIRFISASEKHIKWIRKNIQKITGLDGHMSHHKPYRQDQTTNMWEIKFTKKDSLKLYPWLYYSQNAPCLLRKRYKIEKFIESLKPKKITLATGIYMVKDISLLTRVNIKSGKLVYLIPEFYELKNSVENSADYWHQQESVFDHTISVISALEKILSKNKNLKVQLEKKISNHTKKDLLRTASVFHDIGKKEAMIEEKGFTKCPGHEKMGVEKTNKILKRFGLSTKESKRILDIICNHSEFHHILKPDNQNLPKDLITLKNKVGDIYPELVLLSYADTVNSKFKSIDPKGYKYRIDFYKKEAKSL